MHPANNMDALLKKEINPAKMKEIVGGIVMLGIVHLTAHARI